MSVFGSELPLASVAFFRLTVPTIGLTGREFAGRARIEIRGTRESLLHGAIDRCGHFERGRRVEVLTAAVGGDRLQRRDVCRSRLDRDDHNRHAFGDACHRSPTRTTTPWLPRCARPCTPRRRCPCRQVMSTTIVLRQRAIGRRIAGHRRDRGGACIGQREVERTIRIADARHAGGNQRRGIVRTARENRRDRRWPYSPPARRPSFLPVQRSARSWPPQRLAR